MNLTFFNKTGSTQIEHFNAPWSELIQFFSSFKECTPEERQNYQLFSGWEMKPHEEAKFTRYENGGEHYSRCIENCTFLNFLTLDVDNDPDKNLPYLTIDQAIEDLSGMEAFFYSSYNHLNSAKHGGVHKFRVLIPLHEPLPLTEYQARRASFRELFPSAASESFTPSQPYWPPLQHPDRSELSFTYHSQGEFLNWNMLKPQIQASPIYSNPNTTSAISTENSVQIQATKQGAGKGQIKSAIDWYNTLLEGWEHRVPCFSCERVEHNPSSFFFRQGAYLKHYDKGGGNGDGHWLNIRCASLFELKFVRKINEVPEEIVEPEVEIEEPKLKVERPEERIFKPISTMEERRLLIRGFTQRFLKVSNKHGVLRAPEGIGKTSIIVEELIKHGQDVLLCCLSHIQVKEKLKDFAKYDPIRVHSLGGLILDTYGVKAISNETETFTWDDPGIDLDRTIMAIMEKVQIEEADLLEALQELAAIAAESRRSKAQVLITTFATGSFLFTRSHGCLDRVVIVDDASMGDLLTAKYNTDEDDETVIIERETDEVMFGLVTPFQSKILWTTTEQLVLRTIDHQHQNSFIHDLKQNIDTKEQIFILPSFLVQKKTKLILPGIHRVIQNDTKTEQFIIANGAKTQLNLVNTKGRNDLMKDGVIIISYPHPSDVAAVTHTLGLGIEHRNEIRIQMCVDIMDQAIGRGPGYRSDMVHTLVVCDPNLEVSLRMRSRYRLNTPVGLKRRGRLHGCPIEWHVEIPNWWSAWFGFLTTWKQYVDVQFGQIINTLTLDGFDLTPKQQKEVKRMLESPTEFSELVWKTYSEYVEGDGRRNHSIIITELVPRLNNQVRHAQTKGNAKGGSNRKGQRKFINPLTKEVGQWIPGTEPHGWFQVKNRMNK